MRHKQKYRLMTEKSFDNGDVVVHKTLTWPNIFNRLMRKSLEGPYRVLQKHTETNQYWIQHQHTGQEKLAHAKNLHLVRRHFLGD